MAFRDLIQSKPVNRAITGLASAYLKFALHTTRWRLDCTDANLRLLTTEPAILAFWHERLLLMPIVWQLSRRAGGSPHDYPKVNVLISRHRDGRMIASIVSRFGARIVHGSSAREKDGRATERGGAAAVRRLARLLRAGEHVVITPDGPRGPPRTAKLGLAHLERITGCPILPCAASTSPHVHLPTWDRMMVPIPFGRGVVTIGSPVTVLSRARRSGEPAIKAALDDAIRRTDGQ